MNTLERPKTQKLSPSARPPSEALPSNHLTRLEALETKLSERNHLLDSNSLRLKNVLAAKLLLETSEEHKEKRAQRMMDCASIHTVKRGEEGYYLSTNHCHDRLCPECAKLKAWQLGTTIEDRLSNYRHPRFLTLTMKHHDGELGTQITRVITAFRRLRSRSVWKQCVSRGIYAVEWKHEKTGNGWHAHIHCVVDATYISKQWIAQEWLKITGDSYIVHIKRVDTSTARYMAKYMSKAVTTETLTEQLWPLAIQLKGRRLCGKFGDEQPLKEDLPPCTDEYIGTLHEVIQAAAEGDRTATQILRELTFKYRINLDDTR